MPAPIAAEYEVTAIVAAHQALLDLLDAGAGDAELVILSSTDTALATAALDLSASAVNGTTGQLTLVATATTGATSGVAAYGEVRDKGGAAQFSLPAQAGNAAVSGKLVINTLTIIVGQPVSVVSLTVG